ncbi:MAG: sigma-70 family RNA polymerase sigma factor [Verrucomicrobiaceae bacterium]|nr:MAG: sigma-70 family RNA polymerase sigma factor [Verrucomicrobiaceae bacterium]
MADEGQPVSEITLLLRAVRQDGRGDCDLMAAIYRQLRHLATARMALEAPGQTLQPTALVHEAWLRLGNQEFENRAHFFGAAAEAMRRILVDRARRRQCAKHGGGVQKADIADMEIAAPADSDELLAVNEALDRLAAHDARKAELVKLRYFIGLSFEESAELLGISVPTAKRDWSYARAWLHVAISTG